MTISTSNYFSPVEFNAINHAALECIESVLIDFLGLDIKKVGRELQFINTLRGDTDFGSASINTETGVWCDFAEEHEFKGGDVVSFVAKMKGIDSQRKAALELKSFLDKSDKANSYANTTIRRAQRTSFQDENDVRDVIALAESELPEFSMSLTGFGKPVRLHKYHNIDGLVVCIMARYENAKGEKSFRPAVLERDSQGQIRWSFTGYQGPRPLYGLAELGAKPGADIVFCEGEKAVEAAQKLFPECVVMTTMHGAQSASKTDFSPLQGRTKIWIWPDHDEAGTKYANDIAREIHAISSVTEVRILKPHLLVPSKYGVSFDKGEHPKGWDAADAFEEKWTKKHGRLLLENPDYSDCVEFPQDMQLGSHQDVIRIDNFVVNENGVYWVKNVGESEQFIWLASRIVVKALARDTSSNGWGILTSFLDPDGKEHIWCIPKSMFGKDLPLIWSRLLEMGLDIAPASDLRNHFARYLLTVKPECKVISSDKSGWHGDVFVMPDGQCYGSSTESVVFQTPDPRLADAFNVRGTLDDWQQKVGTMCAGNSRLMLAVCTALTGPVLTPLGEEAGGFHFRGESSIGKTSTLLPACSVWGQTDKVMKQWRVTSNGLEAVACQHNDLLLVLDEIAQITPQEAGEAAYMLANGQGKARANQNGGARSVATWKQMILSTGEIGLADHLASRGERVRAGQEARLIDVPARVPGGHGVFDTLHGRTDGSAFARELKQAALDSYGALGRAWLELLTSNQAKELLDVVKRLCHELEGRWMPDGACGQVSRVVHRFALVCAVGVVCVQNHLLPWSESDVIRAIKCCFDAWLSLRGSAENLEVAQVVEQARNKLLQYGSTHFLDLGNTEDRARSYTGLWGYRERLQDGRYSYFAFAETFKNEICEGLDRKSAITILTEKGYLIQSKPGVPYTTKRLPGSGSTKVYHLSADLLGGAEQYGDDRHNSQPNLNSRYVI